MTFPLKIATLDRGLCFNGEAEKLILRTVSGDAAILAGHADYVAPLGMGQAVVEAAGERRYGACIGGLVTVIGGRVTLVPTTFEWAGEIDEERAKQSENRARQILEGQPTDVERQLAQARLRRALLRQSVARNGRKKQEI